MPKPARPGRPGTTALGMATAHASCALKHAAKPYATMIWGPIGWRTGAFRWGGAAGITWTVLAAALVGLGPAPRALAQARNPHWFHQGAMPPGAIGSLRLQRGGPVQGFFQPVEIRAPHGVLIALAEGGGFGEAQTAPVQVGLLIGQVYRLRVMNIPLHEGAELFPTIEVIDRLYAPPGLETRFPIVVDLHLEDLTLALDGKFVTRVIYLEDPQNALPVPDNPREQAWYEVGPGQDPLAVADQLGRPVAIVRMGARVPGEMELLDGRFLYGCPPLVKYPPKVKVLPRPPKGPEPPTALQGPAARDSTRARR